MPPFNVLNDLRMRVKFYGDAIHKWRKILTNVPDGPKVCTMWISETPYVRNYQATKDNKDVRERYSYVLSRVHYRGESKMAYFLVDAVKAACNSRKGYSDPAFWENLARINTSYDDCKIKVVVENTDAAPAAPPVTRNLSTNSDNEDDDDGGDKELFRRLKNLEGVWDGSDSDSNFDPAAVPKKTWAQVPPESDKTPQQVSVPREYRLMVLIPTSNSWGPFLGTFRETFPTNVVTLRMETWYETMLRLHYLKSVLLHECASLFYYEMIRDEHDEHDECFANYFVRHTRYVVGLCPIAFMREYPFTRWIPVAYDYYLAEVTAATAVNVVEAATIHNKQFPTLVEAAQQPPLATPVAQAGPRFRRVMPTGGKGKGKGGGKGKGDGRGGGKGKGGGRGGGKGKGGGRGRGKVMKDRTSQGLFKCYFTKLTKIPEGKNIVDWYWFPLNNQPIEYRYVVHKAHGPQMHIYADVQTIKSIYQFVYPDDLTTFESWGGNDTEAQFSAYGQENDFENAFERAFFPQ